MVSMQTGPPSEADMVSFMEKLADFHETLTPGEQAILDQVTATALTGGDDVEGFLYSPVPSLRNFVLNPSLLPSPRPFYAHLASYLQ
jgi:hypothetical protein